jgi:hypothetical protein
VRIARLDVELGSVVHHGTVGVTMQTSVLARPTGVGHALTAYRMPIEGRDEWIAAVERLA